jgi:hypothetical protein
MKPSLTLRGPEGNLAAACAAVVLPSIRPASIFMFVDRVVVVVVVVLVSCSHYRFSIRVSGLPSSEIVITRWRRRVAHLSLLAGFSLCLGFSFNS